MNSLILTSLAAFFKGFTRLWRESGTYAVLMRIYGFFSNSWKNSGIMSFLRKNERDEMPSSSAARLFKLPFSVLEQLRLKIGGFLETNVKNSFICVWSKKYIQNFMALNTRFFGVMICWAAIGRIEGKSASIQAIKAELILLAIGIVLALVNYNLMLFLNPSKFVTLIKSALGFKNLDFDFFEEEQTRGNNGIRIALEVVVGAIMGFVSNYSLIYGAVIPFAAFGMLLVMYCPLTGVFASVFLAPFAPTMALAGICLWTMLSLAIKSLTEKDFKWRFDGVGLGIMLLLAILFISSALSFARAGSLRVWAMYFVFMNYYFVIVNTVKTKEQIHSLLKLFVISGALVALYGIAQYVFGWTTSNAWIDEEMFEDATMRVYSTLGNPNVLGEYLLLVLPVAAVYMIKYRFKELAKYAYAAMFLVLALCLVLTQSRGCWIGFVVSVALFVTFYEGKWWGLIPIALCILPFVVPKTIVERLMSIGNMEDSSTSYRVFIWMGTLGLLKYYWLGGIGMGEAAFSQVYPFFSYNAIVAPHSHNTFLQLTVEAGVGALIAFLALNIAFIKKTSDTYRLGEKKSLDSAMSLALGCGIIGFLSQSMFDYTFYNYRVMAVMFMVLAMGMAMYHIKKEEMA